MSKNKSASEACKTISKSLKKQIDEYKASLAKTEKSPKEAGVKVAGALLKHFKELKDQLAKIETLEKTLGGGLPATPAESNVNVANKFGPKQTVFGILGKMAKTNGAPMAPPSANPAPAMPPPAPSSATKSEDELSKVTPPNISEETMHKLKAQYPGEKDKAYATAWKISKEKKDTKKSEDEGLACEGCDKNLKPEEAHIIHPDTKKVVPASQGASSLDSVYCKGCATRVSGKYNKTKKAEGSYEEEIAAEDKKGKKPLLPGTAKLNDLTAKDTGAGSQITLGKKMKKSESPIFNKALTTPGEKDLIAHPGTPAGMVKANIMPRLGGKDVPSTQMTQHAFMAAGQVDKNKKMPAAQQSIKMPNPQEHAQRASSYADFMPKGKFDKSEWEKEQCSYCKAEMHSGKCK